jgi:predicted transcriptional regulator
MTDDLHNRVTGDQTYKDRLARYEYVVQRRAEKPQPTIEAIAKELGISKQNVSRLLSRGTVRPSGRQPSNEGRKKALQKRIDTWQARRQAHIEAGKPTDREDSWISDLTARLAALD